MASDKMVEQITAMDVDFAKWYTDVVKKAELIDYSSVKGCVILRPYAYALWENIQRALDDMLKASGHENVYMPLFIPESLLQKEKDHVDGFAPEVAWVTHGGSEPLTERMCVRPTSETLFCEHYKNIIHSWRDLPKLYNQWCSVVRWEKTTRPFLRGREFLWQEGHTIHATAEEADAEAMAILEFYADLAENWLAMPVIRGQKTESEKFAGAQSTYAIECMMHDGKALQAGTTHFFGDGFAKAFEIQFTDRENKLRYPHQSSWGVTTRLIGGIIMTHGDDNGLLLPPKIAPVQVVVIPVAAHKPGVLDAAKALCDGLRASGLRVKLDDSDNNPGWKYAEHEMKGVPVRLELGPRDIEAGTCMVVRRDTREKAALPLEGIAGALREMLDSIQADLLARARTNLENRTFSTTDAKDLARIVPEGGFARAMWCGDAACEDKLKADYGVSSRCIPFEQQKLSDSCICCGKPAEKMVLWAVAY